MKTYIISFLFLKKKVVEKEMRADLILLFQGIITNHVAFVGEVVLLVNMPADSPADEGQQLPDGRTATPTSTFTQQDINEGIVWYRHSGVPAQSDSFRFQVLCFLTFLMPGWSDANHHPYL